MAISSKMVLRIAAVVSVASFLTTPTYASAAGKNPSPRAVVAQLGVATANGDCDGYFHLTTKHLRAKYLITCASIEGDPLINFVNHVGAAKVKKNRATVRTHTTYEHASYPSGPQDVKALFVLVYKKGQWLVNDIKPVS